MSFPSYIIKKTAVIVLQIAVTAVLFACGNANSQEYNTTEAQVGDSCRWIADIDLPQPLTDRSEQILYRKAYIVSYNKETKQPNWVAWRLTAEHTDGNVRRP
ncbi:MAG: DNA/RNA non-specific endonuclease, partial [Bacteroides sp.]|nr:DNA/RNA non-specific endonuclease [Bacteroides sp.]